MLKIKQFSIKSKLMVMLLTASLGSIAIVNYLAWNKAKETLQETIFTHLTSVRATKREHIENYFKNIQNHLETLCEDRMVVAAMVEFNKGFKKLNDEYVERNLNAEIERYYQTEFFPRLSKTIEGVPNYETYAPTSQAAQYLQYHYIAKNPNPIGQKDELVDAKDGSEYSKYHEKYHSIFRNITKKFGYYNFFLIDFKTGDIVYTVYKETDFATNLNEGPYRQTNLAQAVAKVRENPERGAIQMVDFSPYRPSYGKPAAFIAGPIYNGPHVIGILAVQLPIDEIDNVLTGNGNWVREGLGNTGQTYLIGGDLLMRSNARYLLEDPEGYKKVLRASGTAESTINSIAQQNTSILLQRIDTEATRAALGGKEGIKVVDNYRGVPVLSSYSPVKIDGVHWAILAEMTLHEAYESVSALQNFLLIGSVIVILVMTYLANLAAINFVKPIDTIVKSTRPNDPDNAESDKYVNAKDEFDEIGQIVSEMRQTIHQNKELLEEKNRENEELLLNMMPSSMAERLKKGETLIAESFPQVTVLFASINGFGEVVAQREVQQNAAILNDLIDMFDQEAEKYDVEKFAAIGERYIAVCGLTKPHLDQAKRMVDFAQAMLEVLKQANNKHRTQLSLRIGIHTGEVMAGIIGNKKFAYNIWGETVNIARILNVQAELHTITISKDVYERVRDLYRFEKGKDVQLETTGKIGTWVLRKKWLTGLMADLMFDEEEDPLNSDDDRDLKDDRDVKKAPEAKENNALAALGLQSPISFDDFDDLDAKDTPQTKDAPQTKEKNNQIVPGLQSLLPLDDLDERDPFNDNA
ncbi:adenylate/guanylate cyclase domain-containing protein [Aerosakkonema funiforme]|uniref:Adenylate/guanylate cyclase domain-containing protein n=2 Tax=Oscillatoriophycideae TaxID=1301283 RepID=A0A926VK35_9CYAN|nr:adenylate/guanylate cyclase domain-containing protein [Aerosakkonema funiforme]MBD2185342.1 adenylate/guanylate cyclase domain-containing protein [Aerosakkonema funiforme FACHB-1375]